MTLYQKLAEIRKQVQFIQNNKSGYGYNYTSDEAILPRIHDKMSELGVSLIPMITPSTTHITRNETRENKTDKAGNPIEKVSVDYITTADMTYRWVNDSDPSEYIDVPWTLVGIQSSASQSFGSGLTYSMRYFLLKYFNIATSDDDPDEYVRKQVEGEKKLKSADAKKIVTQIDSFVRGILLKNPAAADDVRKIVGNVVKQSTKKDSTNYFDLTDPAAAQKLLDDLTAKYGEA